MCLLTVITGISFKKILRYIFYAGLKVISITYITLQMSPLLSGGPLVWVCLLQLQQWNKTQSTSLMCWKIVLLYPKAPSPSTAWMIWHWKTDFGCSCKAGRKNLSESPNQAETTKVVSRLFSPVGRIKWDADHFLKPIVKFTLECRKWGVELYISPGFSTSVETTAEKELWKISQLQSF